MCRRLIYKFHHKAAISKAEYITDYYFLPYDV